MQDFSPFLHNSANHKQREVSFKKRKKGEFIVRKPTVATQAIKKKHEARAGLFPITLLKEQPLLIQRWEARRSSGLVMKSCHTRLSPLPPLEVFFVEDELDASLCVRNALLLQRLAQHLRTAEEDAHFGPAGTKMFIGEIEHSIFRHLATSF